MNVNRITDPEMIKQKAQQLLSNKEKVNLGKEDLETLWENVKLADPSISELGITDEEAIAQFDALDNEENTAMTSYKLFFNWLRNGAFGSADTPEVNPDDTVVTPPGAEDTPTVPDETPDVPDETPDVPDETPDVPDETPDVPDETPDVPDEIPDVPDETPDVPDETPDTSTTNTPKEYIQLFDQESTTIEIDGKKYNITNTSSTVNNFAYYMQNGVLTFEGSDLVLDSLEEDGAVDDNVKIMGNRNTINLGDGKDTAEVEGTMNAVMGGNGDDFVKLRGDYNTTNLQGGNDTAWIAGNTNVAIGAGGNDNFFAIGSGNTLYGQDDDDGKYYNESLGVGHDYRVENPITDGTDFEKWVNGEEPTDGPPYLTPPSAQDGHEVRAYDDNTYTDKYEQTPNYITEYRDIAYRELQAETTVDRVEVGNATVTKYADGVESEKITISKESVTINNSDGEIVIPADEVVYKDEGGNVINNTGTIDDLVEKLATGKYSIDTTGFEAELPPVTEEETNETPPVQDDSETTDSSTLMMSKPMSAPVNNTATNTTTDTVDKSENTSTDDNVQSEQNVSNASTVAQSQAQKVYVQLFDGESTTLDFDGKQYTFTNVSSTVNNFAYYTQNGVVTIEGSDLTMEAVDKDSPVDDNIKMMGNRNTITVGAGNDTVEIEGALNSVYGGDGDDFAKLRGDYNTASMQKGNDTVWMAGKENTAIGADGEDNFFAIGKGNTLYGQNDTDGKYYNETEGIGHDYRVEDIITDGTDFEKWVKGEPADGPPYNTPPTPEAGHEVRAYDDNTYTDKYEQTPNYITEYRDIAYRGLMAETSVDRVNVGNATVTKYDEGEALETITITPDGITVKNADGEFTYKTGEFSYQDAAGNVVVNTGTIDNLVEMLATGKYKLILPEGLNLKYFSDEE